MRNHRPTTDYRLRVLSFTLEQSYLYCERLTKVHSRTFYLASAFLPTHKRRAMRALYAFCRVSDNLVDAQSEDCSRQAQFEAWRRRSLADDPPLGDPVALAWA